MKSVFGSALLMSIAFAGWGHFEGVVQTQWLDDGRKMKLLSDFGYVDQSGEHWRAPKDSIIDGASIPKIFWSIAGGPFEGRYRNASVLHDVECIVQTRSWQKVHRMFYNAMRLGGVDPVPAKIMYFAVYARGPRWPKGIAPFTVTSDDDLLRGQKYIREHPTITLEQIEQLTSPSLRKAVPRVPPAVRMEVD